MKNYVLATCLLMCTVGITACGGGSDNGTIKVDTVVNPADNTNTKQIDSTKPANAPAIDTVGGGQSTSSGAKDTTKKK